MSKRANYQSLVPLTLAAVELLIPVSVRLFLPAEWLGDAHRCARAGVPDAATATDRPRIKGEIAFSELYHVAAAGARFGCVLADAGYGTSAAFRHALDTDGLRWAASVTRDSGVAPVKPDTGLVEIGCG